MAQERENRLLWESGLADMACQPNSAQLDQLQHYVSLLTRWNKTYNLTAVRDPKEMIALHVFDSLVVADYLKGDHCLDVGSGAGLPGIPLAIMLPGVKFDLLDSNGKKTRFMQQAIIELGLNNTRVQHCRIEDFPHANQFDIIISRAFANIKDTIRKLADYSRSDGRFLFMKSRTVEDELKILDDSYTAQCFKLSVPGMEADRVVVIVSRNEHKQR